MYSSGGAISSHMLLMLPSTWWQIFVFKDVFDFWKWPKSESDIGTNIFVTVGVTSEMRCDHHIIIFMDLSDKRGLEAILKEVFPVS